MIDLIRPRGTEKTTMGQLVAKQRNLAFIDIDKQISETVKMSISQYVSQFDWDTFRRRETEVLMSLCESKCVVSTGGCVVLSSKNCDYLRQTGMVIYLQSFLSSLTKRLSTNPDFLNVQA